MPNWCEGTLKLRGKCENVLEALKSELSGGVIETNKWGDIKFTNIHNKRIGRRTLKVKQDVLEWHVSDKREDEEHTVCLEVESAWAFVLDELERISRTYDIDVRAHGYESGIEFEQIVTCLRGEEIVEEVLRYEDFKWECPFPHFGG